MTRAAYDLVADVYADHVPSTEPEQPIELAMIEHFVSLLPEPRRVLDAGCGAGRMLPHLAALGCMPEGIDLSPQMVRRARQDHPGHPVRVGSLTELPWGDEEFDGVFAWYSTIHSPDEVLDVIVGELRRVLRRGGCLLVAWQVGTGVRQVGEGFRALGYDVTMRRYHRTLATMVEQVTRHDLDVVSHLERGPVAGESDPQAVLIARRRTTRCPARAPP
nr:class I SAM-dependent methyltransferase [Arsenicicoccus dermatophilus]